MCTFRIYKNSKYKEFNSIKILGINQKANNSGNRVKRGGNYNNDNPVSNRNNNNRTTTTTTMHFVPHSNIVRDNIFYGIYPVRY